MASLSSRTSSGDLRSGGSANNLRSRVDQNQTCAAAMDAPPLRQRRTGQDDEEEQVLSHDGGLRKKILKRGTGELPPRGGTHTMIMHYTGRLENGTIFDSSRTRGRPFEFVLGAGRVISGWERGVATMTRGERALLTCAPDYVRRGGGALPDGGGLFCVWRLVLSAGGAPFKRPSPNACVSAGVRLEWDSGWAHSTQRHFGLRRELAALRCVCCYLRSIRSCGGRAPSPRRTF